MSNAVARGQIPATLYQFSVVRIAVHVVLTVIGFAASIATNIAEVSIGGTPQSSSSQMPQTKVRSAWQHYKDLM